MTVFQASMQAAYSKSHEVNNEMVCTGPTGYSYSRGLLFIIKTITRDYSQGTIQIIYE